MKKKTLQNAIVVIVVLLAAAAAGAWWLAGNADRLVREAIERYGSEMVGAKVSVKSVELRRSGEGIVRGLVIANPPGFKTPHAVKVEEFDIAVDLATLASDVIRVKRINIVAPDLVYERGDGVTNVEAIQRNIDAYLGPGKSRGPGRKLVVDLLMIRGAKAQASAAFMYGRTVEVSLPAVTLKDVGKSRGGVAPGELGQIVANSMQKQLTAAVSWDRMKSALDGAADAVKKLIR